MRRYSPLYQNSDHDCALDATGTERKFYRICRAVVVATNNTPMIFTEHAGSVARRRVIFQFNCRVSEEEKDPGKRAGAAAEETEQQRGTGGKAVRLL